MSEVLEALLLGIVQGLTEFLPVSSSGHLEIAKYLAGDDSVGEQSLLMTVTLHFATACATVFVFRKDIWNLLVNGLKVNGPDKNARNYLGFIVLSMIPAAVAGMFLDEFIESLFVRNMILVGLMLLITGALLLIADFIKHVPDSLNFKSAFIIGIAQAIAIIPGISRSGATISTALLLKISREEAARFSFLMVIPLIFGKMILDVISGNFLDYVPSVAYLLTGFVAAFISGIVACFWMIRLVRIAKLKYFAMYCFVVGIILVTGKFSGWL